MFRETGADDGDEGRIARGCYAAELGDCSGPLNREHFISKNLLKDFEKDDGLYVRGYPHNNVDTILMSAESLSAKMLCERHNNRLSDVDVEGSRFLLAFFRLTWACSTKRSATGSKHSSARPANRAVDLKCLCGLIASGKPGVRNASRGLLPLSDFFRCCSASNASC